MDSDRVGRWLTLAANFGVIVGILFLVIEIRQNSAVATAQVRFDYAAGWRTVDGSRQIESFSRVFTKSIESPEELTISEFVQLDAYYSGVLDQMLSAHTAWTSGLRSTPFVDVAKSVGALYFSNEFAKAWWTQVRLDWTAPAEQEFLEIMDEAISAAEAGRSRRIHMGIQNSLSIGQGRSSN